MSTVAILITSFIAGLTLMISINLVQNIFKLLRR